MWIFSAGKPILILLILVTFIVISIKVFLPSSISAREDGITISTPQNNFYIPTNKPSKIYRFNPNPKELEEIINQDTKDYPATFGIYIKNISTGQEVSINGDTVFNSASLYKLAVMYAIYKKVDEGKLDLNDQVKNNLQSMITVSSNEAAYFLIENYTSWKELTTMMRDLGLKNTDLNQNPIKTTPKDVGFLLEQIALGKIINLDVSVKMLELMLAQKINDRIPVNLPPRVLVAHKTGELEDSRHDAGVVIGPDNNYILVLMTKDSQSPEKIKTVMAKISSDVYNFFATQWANPPEVL